MHNPQKETRSRGFGKILGMAFDFDKPIGFDIGESDHAGAVQHIEMLLIFCQHKYILVRFEVSTAVTMKNGVFWDVTPCGYCEIRRFGGTFRFLHQGDKSR
jgi:hypothetical protein